MKTSLSPKRRADGAVREEMDADAVVSTPANPSIGPAKLLVELLEIFDRDGIRYCYWKSGRRILGALSGQSDLDLLVAREDRQRAAAILDGLNFKRWPDAPGRDQPAVESFLGFDESIGLLLHLHVVYRLFIGHSLFKNLRVPFEKAVLAQSSRHSMLPVRTLDPIDEALLLIIRANLEERWLDPIALRHAKSLSRKFDDDFAWLSPQVDAAALRRRASEWFSSGLADAIAAGFERGHGIPKSWSLRRKLKRELSAFRAYGSIEGRTRTLARSVLWAGRVLNRRVLHWPRLCSRRAPGGGVVVALVGVDGSGKSTMVARSRAWLGAEIDVLPVYFGTGDGPPSPLLLPFKTAARLVSSRMKVRPKGASHGAISESPPSLLYSTLFTIWACAVAAEKRHKLILTQRAAARGIVVIADRYPQNENQNFNDGPLLHRLAVCPDWARRFEAATYRLAERAPPDLVVKLHVGPEAVARREPGMVPAIAIQRIALLHDLRFAGARVVSIDATQSLETVLAAVKRAIWDVL